VIRDPLGYWVLVGGVFTLLVLAVLVFWEVLEGELRDG